jgi:hypothetical protein
VWPAQENVPERLERGHGRTRPGIQLEHGRGLVWPPREDVPELLERKRGQTWPGVDGPSAGRRTQCAACGGGVVRGRADVRTGDASSRRPQCRNRPVRGTAGSRWARGRISGRAPPVQRERIIHIGVCIHLGIQNSKHRIQRLTLESSTKPTSLLPNSLVCRTAFRHRYLCRLHKWQIWRP